MNNIVLISIIAILILVISLLLHYIQKQGFQKSTEAFYKKKAKNVELLLTRALPALKAFSWEIDGRTCNVVYNYEHNEISSVKKSNTLERSASMVHEDDREHYLRNINTALAQGNGSFSFEYRSCTGKDNDFHWWQVRGISERVHAATGDYTRLYGLSICEDEAKAKEQKLIEQANELEVARSKAEESERLKTQFLANVSHEIRTPLNAIVGFSDLLASSNDLSQAEKDSYIKYIKLNNNSLLKIINDIIELSKLEAKIALRPQKKDFGLLLAQIKESLQEMQINQNIELIIEKPYKEAIADIDYSYVAQIILNFASNAIKNTTQGSITIGYNYQADTEMLEIYVKDTGIGIPAEKQKNIFERFQKVDYFKQGIGLGLNVVKAIATRLNFECGFESTENVGSNFWVRGYCPLFVKE